MPSVMDELIGLGRYIVNDIHMNCFGEPAGTPPDDELAIIVENAAKLVAEKPHH